MKNQNDFKKALNDKILFEVKQLVKKEIQSQLINQFEFITKKNYEIFNQSLNEMKENYYNDLKNHFQNRFINILEKSSKDFMNDVLDKYDTLQDEKIDKKITSLFLTLQDKLYNRLLSDLKGLVNKKFKDYTKHINKTIEDNQKRLDEFIKQFKGKIK